VAAASAGAACAVLVVSAAWRAFSSAGVGFWLAEFSCVFSMSLNIYCC
jgi:hypothetical protein